MRGWWRGIRGVLTGEKAVSVPPPPAPPQIESASVESERLKLFEEWIEYERRKEEGMAAFLGDKEILVDFVFVEPGGFKVLVGVEAIRQEGNKQVELLPESAAERLLEKGFHPPDSDHEYNYWQEFDIADSSKLAALAESVFREILGEDENFTAERVEFKLI